MTPTIRAAARIFNTTPADIVGPSRFAIHVRPRDAVAWVMRERGKSFPQIGRALGRDHSTIIDAVRRAETRRAVDRHFRAACAKLAA